MVALTRPQSQIHKAKLPSSFESLPIELQLNIVELNATTSPFDYQSLLLVSRHVYDLVRACDAFGTTFPIVLRNDRKVASFYHFLQSRPCFAARVTDLWMVGGYGTDDIRLQVSILNQCINVVRLAGLTTVLSTSTLADGSAFQHTQCSDLTIVDSRPYRHASLFATHKSIALCQQLSHLRTQLWPLPKASSYNIDNPPYTQRFVNLTHLSVPYECLALNARDPIAGLVVGPWDRLKDESAFPALKEITKTIDYKEWNPSTILKSTGLVNQEMSGVDDRLRMFRSPCGWDERAAWEGKQEQIWRNAKLELSDEAAVKEAATATTA